MGLSENLKRVLKWFLLILFLGYYGSIVLFTHTHLINGVTIVHSHPYKPFSDDGSPSHNHSSNEIVVLQALSGFFSTVVLSFIALAIFRHVTNINHPLKNQWKEFVTDFYSFLLRAPPIKFS
jgi:hypothetical protein